MIVNDKVKSYSLFTTDENQEELVQLLAMLLPEERAAFELALESVSYEQDIRGLELEREIVPTKDWLEDPYYAGEVAKNLYAPWKQDLIELCDSGAYQVAVITGGLGCVAEATRIDVGGRQVPIGDLTDPHKYLSWDGRRWVRTLGTAPFPKGRAPLYRVVHERGEFVAAGHHLVLCGDGTYRRVLDLHAGHHALVAPRNSTDLQDSSSESSLSVLRASARRLMQTVQGCRDGCSDGSHLCDGRPLWGRGSARAFVPSPSDAQEYDRYACAVDSARMDALRERGRLRNHLDRRFDRPSKKNSDFQRADLCGVAADCFGLSVFPRSSYGRQPIQRLLLHSVYHRTVDRSYGVARALRLSANLGVDLEKTFDLLSAKNTHHPLLLSVEKVKTDWYWDLQVPGTHNYVAEGVVHHNSGKSFFSHLAVLRMLYEASCLKDPVQSYGLARGSVIAFCNLAKSKETARRAVFEGIISKMREMPYFRLEFPPIKDNKDELIFQKGLALIAGSSTDTSIIGLNIAGGIIDEGNFFQKAGGTVVTALDSGENRWGAYARIGRLYDSVLRRIKSRFANRGRLPGFLLVASSKTTQDSFTERIVRQALTENDTRLFVRDRAIIDVKRQYFSEETFRVLVGTEAYPSRILEKDEDVSGLGDEAIIIEVPEDLREDFTNNLEESLRDLAGVSTVAIASFMGRVDVIDAMKDARVHPFVCPLFSNPMDWDSRLPFTIHWTRLARQRDNGEWEPLRHPEAKRWVHLDPASTGDAFGLCIGHVAGMKAVTRDQDVVDDGVEEMTEYQPVFEVDFILRIKGEKGSEIQFKNVRKIIYKFSEHGFHISGVTTDSYQSREMIQALTDQGYKAEMVSVDTSKEPYRTLRQAIYDGRVRCYDYPVLFRELKQLEDTPTKIDHPLSGNGSKDCADALCGMVWGLFNAGYVGEPLAPQKGISESPDNELLVNESFQSIKTTDDGSAVIEPDPLANGGGQSPANPVKVYKKNRPKSVAPSYKKVGADGKIEDLKNQKSTDTEDTFVRG